MLSATDQSRCGPTPAEESAELLEMLHDDAADLDRLLSIVEATVPQLARLADALYAAEARDGADVARDLHRSAPHLRVALDRVTAELEKAHARGVFSNPPNTPPMAAPGTKRRSRRTACEAHRC